LGRGKRGEEAEGNGGGTSSSISKRVKPPYLGDGGRDGGFAAGDDAEVGWFGGGDAIEAERFGGGEVVDM